MANRCLLAIVSLSVVLRIAAALYLGNTVTVQPGTADQLSYHTLALRVLGGHGFSFDTGWWPATPAGEPTAHWSYLYVLFLAVTYAIAGPVPLVARLLQAVIVGILHPALTYAIARRLFGTRVGLVSAALVAGYAYFIYYAGALMTESFFFVAVLWSIYVATGLAADRQQLTASGGWVSLGLALLAAVLLRQAVLVCVPFILMWVVWRVMTRDDAAFLGRGQATVLMRGLSVTLMVMVAGILPWTLRNYRAFDRFVLLNTNAGFAFYWGNHPIHGRRFIPILPGDGSIYGRLIPDDLRSRNEADMDRALLGRGVAFVTADPVRYAALSASRVIEFVKFWPSGESDRVSNVARVMSFGVCAPFLLLGVALEIRPGRRRVDGAERWLVLGVALVYSLAHILTWTLVRYRLPADALLLPFAALSLVHLADWVARAARTVRPDLVVTG